jgi:hypothetical protein
MALRQLLVAVAAVVAAIPGLSLFISKRGAPEGKELLYGMILEIVGAATVLVLWLRRKHIRRLSKRRAIRVSTACLAVGLLSVFGYGSLFDHSDIPSGVGARRFWLPAVAVGPLGTLIDDTPGGRTAIVEAWGAGEVYERLVQTPQWALVLTDATLLALGAAFIGGTACAFVVLGLRVVADGPD